MAPKKGKKEKKTEVDHAKTEEASGSATSQVTEDVATSSQVTVESKKTTKGKKQKAETLEEAAAALRISADEDDASPSPQSQEKVSKKEAPRARPRPDPHLMNETFVVLPHHRYYTRSKITNPLKEDPVIEENAESVQPEPGQSKEENPLARPAKKKRGKAKAKENVSSEIEDEKQKEVQVREKSTDHPKPDPSAENH